MSVTGSRVLGKGSQRDQCMGKNCVSDIFWFEFSGRFCQDSSFGTDSFKKHRLLPGILGYMPPHPIDQK